MCSTSKTTSTTWDNYDASSEVAEEDEGCDTKRETYIFDRCRKLEGGHADGLRTAIGGCRDEAVRESSRKSCDGPERGEQNKKRGRAESGNG